MTARIPLLTKPHLSLREVKVDQPLITTYIRGFPEVPVQLEQSRHTASSQNWTADAGGTANTLEERQPHFNCYRCLHASWHFDYSQCTRFNYLLHFSLDRNDSFFHLLLLKRQLFCACIRRPSKIQSGLLMLNWKGIKVCWGYEPSHPTADFCFFWSSPSWALLTFVSQRC